MTPFEKKILETMASLVSIKHISPQKRLEIATKAEAIYNKVVEIIPKIVVDPYAVSSGHNVVKRARIKAPGVKFILNPSYQGKTPAPRMGLWARDVIPALIYAKADGYFVTDHKSTDDSSIYKHTAREVVDAELLANFGTEIQQKLDAARPASESIDEATSKAFANRQRSMDTAKRAALERLSYTMTEYNYSEEEVIEAWQISQVRRIHDA